MTATLAFWLSFSAKNWWQRCVSKPPKLPGLSVVHHILPMLPLSRLCPMVHTHLAFLRTCGKRHDKWLCLAFVCCIWEMVYKLYPSGERRTFFICLHWEGRRRLLLRYSLLPIHGSLAETQSFLTSEEKRRPPHWGGIESWKEKGMQMPVSFWPPKEPRSWDGCLEHQYYGVTGLHLWFRNRHDVWGATSTWSGGMTEDAGVPWTPLNHSHVCFYL